MKVFETFIGQWGLVLPVKLVIEEVLIKWSQNLHVFTVFAIFRILDFIQICGEKSLWQSFGTLKYELTLSTWQFQSIFRQLSHGVLLFSLDAVFMKEFVKQNEHFYIFWGENEKKPLSSGKFVPLKTFPDFFIWAHHPPLSERNILHSKTLIRDQRWQFQD